MVACIALLPVFNNFREVLGVGHYNTNMDFNHSFIEGTGGLNIEFDLTLTVDDRHTANLYFNVISTGSVGIIGITSIEYYIYRDTISQQIIARNYDYDPPITSLYKNHVNLRCYKYNEIYLYGEAFVKFLVGGIEQQVSIEFELMLLITVSSGDVSYFWNLAEVWLQVIDGIVIAVLVIVLARLIRHLRFDKWYTEEHRKEDEEFFEKMREYVRKKKVPQSS
ncbi:MAG: hypothetical protein ACFFDX_12000 [Candidatus Odinarchaeota archaeon]